MLSLSVRGAEACHILFKGERHGWCGLLLFLLTLVLVIVVMSTVNTMGMGVLERTRETMNRQHKERNLIVSDFEVVFSPGFSLSPLRAAMTPKEIPKKSVFLRTYDEFDNINGRRE